MKKLRMAGSRSISLVFLIPFSLLLIAFSSNSATCTAASISQSSLAAPTPGAPDPRGEPGVAPAAPRGRQMPADLAPGYCPSSGGSTQYERVSDVSLQPNADGAFLLTIQVYIANPTGCTAGQPCPAYDSSPEYVNAWIDWNGNQAWEPSEQVLDKALTGYTGINYQGTMTAIGLVTPPAAPAISEATANGNDNIWLRTNVGYNHDPNDPCEQGWGYGNVVDKPVAIKPPKIKEIKVKGEKDVNNPMTGYYVTMEAILDLPPGYEEVAVKWTGDIEIPGTGNPYSFRPFKGEHRKRKVKATLTYRNTATSATGQTSKEREFKLFFEKNGDDNGDSIPNWFDYWGKDGAVPRMVAGADDAPVVYNATGVDFGSWDDKTRTIKLGPDAARFHDIRHVTPNEHCIGGDYGGGQGSDAVTEVIAHERWHEFIWKQWYVNKVWTIGVTPDSDDPTPNDKADPYGDSLPDDFEINASKTDPKQNDSCGLAHIGPDYAGYGDNEFSAMLEAKTARGVAQNDWANPGKQSTPPYVAEVLATAATVDRKASGPVTASAQIEEPGAVFPGLAQLTGSYTDSSVDANGDGQLEALRITAGVNVITPTRYVLIGWLRDSNGVDFAWANHLLDLSAGIQPIDLEFDGKLIQQHSVNGPFTLRRVELRVGDHGHLVAFADNPHTTAAYAASTFLPPAVTFTGSYTDQGSDSDADALYNSLNVSVGVQVNAPGNYTVLGWLSDANGNSVPGGDASAVFTASGVQTLAFDGRSIRWQRANGPYKLRYLEVRDANQERVIFLDTAYTTGAYTYSQFQGSATAIDAASYSDQGLDVNGDGKYDYLRVALQVNVATAGAYHIEAMLSAGDRETLVSAQSELSLTTGSNTVNLSFPAGLIRNSAINGPYQVTAVTLIDANANIVDYQRSAHTTQAYAYTDFALPLVALTNNYRDYTSDANGDGANDYLNIDVGINAGNSGVVIVQGRLVDSTGHEIQQVEKSTQMNAGAAQTVTLPFSATLIAANGQDGPFELRNLLVYHTGDPTQSISVSAAHTTATYRHQDLTLKEPSGNTPHLYLPLITNVPRQASSTCVPAPPGESNNVADAITICSGQAVTGQVRASDLDDVYKIQAKAKQQITILLHGTGGDADLYLYAPGTSDVVSDPIFAKSTTTGNTESIQALILVAGYWYVDIFSFSGATDYNFTVTLSTAEQTTTQDFTPMVNSVHEKHR